ncbi:glycosyltransferase 61 family protein [Sphingomonas crusticola]|uniref:glycosyltransferase 61 family protein n=1 Tax=Sphingomonas crusticola TaxID=1697973 RepID=UPI0013C31F9A|nr:glycosyltransferase 61 family protein [Sphingomonas crusticola]
MTLPEPHRVSDAVLGPLVPATHPSAIGCIADTPGTTLTHIRADTPEGPVNRLEVHEAVRSADMAQITGPTLYAGPYLAHFGHMIAECIHRLWAAHAFPHLANVRIAFQASPQAPRPPWFDAVLDLCGIAPERVLLVEQPIAFQTLYIPAQGRALGGAVLLPGYVDLFPLTAIAPPPEPARRLYISRSHHIRSGTYLGETLIEHLLAEAGFTIVRPEEMPLRVLAGLLRTAEQIVFAEGSAIHNLELCGPVQARILVIGRRPGTKRRFGALLASLSRDVEIFSGARGAASLGWDALHDMPRLGTACSFLPIGKLVDMLSAFSGIALPQPDANTILDAVSRDLLRYLLDPRSGVDASDAELGRALRALRTDPAVEEVRSMLTR